MKYIPVYLFKGLTILIYYVCRLFPVKDRVLFLSRQSDDINLDFDLIRRELSSREDYDMKFICRRQESGLISLIRFLIANLKAISSFAVSKICVLDSYSVPVCLVRHPKNRTVIQIWHAVGKIKQSGYQTLGKKGGRDAKLADILHMHWNYDVVIAGGRAWNPAYCASFGVDEDVLYNVGLPRMDYLLDTAEENREKVFAEYPELRGKKILLYAPTFRRWGVDEWRALCDHVDHEKYALIVKAHPNQDLDTSGKNCYTCDKFKAIELLSSADYLITDYSAIAVEAAMLNVKTYYFIYDKETYVRDNGLNLDIETEMPGCSFRDAKELVAAIETGNYPQEELDKYRQRFLPDEPGYSTGAVADIIESCMKYGDD